MPDIIALGECMVELLPDQSIISGSTVPNAVGGDTLNLLVAASRLGSSTGYITLVGDDPFAKLLLESWWSEGIDTSEVRLIPGFNGVYSISLNEFGEIEFQYCRADSAASTIAPEYLNVAEIAQACVLHTSGITQAISRSSRTTVLEAVRQAHEAGVIVSFDPNYRPNLWKRGDAYSTLMEILPFCDIFLPSHPRDTTDLMSIHDPEQCIRKLWDWGVGTVAVKMGEEGCLVGRSGRIDRVPSYKPSKVVDTTGAGDAFGGALLHGLNDGMTLVEAAHLGNAVVALTIQSHGAVASIPGREEVENCFRRHAN